MKLVKARVSGIVLTVAIFGAAACSQTTQVASACKAGQCDGEVAPIRTDPPTCTLAIWEGLTTFSSNHIQAGVAIMCMDHPLPRLENGSVECDVKLSLENDEETQRACRDIFAASAHSDGGPKYCWVPRRASGNAGAVGAYYDEASDQVHDRCGRARQGLAVDLGAFEPEGHSVTLEAQCRYGVAYLPGVDVLDNPDDQVYLSTDSCFFPDQASDAARWVGRSCEPRVVVPPDGFSAAEAYLDGASAQCGTGMCMVFHIHGRVDAACDETRGDHCVDPQGVEDRIQCTCRCDADDPGAAKLCQCPNGYQCVPMVKGSGAASGSYCVDASIVAL